MDCPYLLDGKFCCLQDLYTTCNQRKKERCGEYLDEIARAKFAVEFRQKYADYIERPCVNKS